MKILNLFTILALGLFVFGCAGADKPATDNTVKPANEAAQAEKKDDKADAEKAETKSDAAGVTGVAACDEYLAAMEKFVDNPKVPQATRDAYKKTMEQNRDAWKQAASTPQGKAGLETGCKAALDAAKTTLEQFK